MSHPPCGSYARPSSPLGFPVFVSLSKLNWTAHNAFSKEENPLPSKNGPGRTGKADRLSRFCIPTVSLSATSPLHLLHPLLIHRAPTVVNRPDISPYRSTCPHYHYIHHHPHYQNSPCPFNLPCLVNAPITYSQAHQRYPHRIGRYTAPSRPNRRHSLIRNHLQIVS